MTRRVAPFAAIGGGRRAACLLVSLLLVLGTFPDVGRAMSRSAAQSSPAEQTSTRCSFTQLGSTVELCLSTPPPRRPITDVATIAVTVEVSDRSVRPLSVDFELNGRNILSDFDPSYEFELVATAFADGEYTISATARMSDKSRTNPVASRITLFSGTASAPASANDFEPRTGRPAANGTPFVLAAVGDGAGGSGQSAAVADLIDSWNPNMFLYLGDVYKAGSPLEFANWYAPDTFFGRFRDITNPTIGNHEYSGDKGPVGYLHYWGNPPNYYSGDTAGWHIVNLDSNPKFNETEPGTAQIDWLVNDLESSTAACTIVFFHHPVFSAGSHGDTQELAALWNILVEHNVTLVLSAHDHNYQRWLPMNAAGRPDPAGPTSLVIGTGGQSEYASQRKDERLGGPFILDSGALRMELNRQGAAIQFLTTDGVVRDNTVAACDRSSRALDTEAPAAPGMPSVTQEADGAVVLRWAPALDDTGIAAYDIYRNDALAGSVAPGVTFVDPAPSGAAIATYRVVARDGAGNQSVSSETTAVVPGHDPSIAFADSFGSGSLERWTTVSGLAIAPAPDRDGPTGPTARARGGIQAAFARVVLPRPVIPPATVDLTVTLDFRLLAQGPNPVVLMRLFSRDSDSLLGASINPAGELTIRNDVTDSVIASSTRVTSGEWHRLTVRLSGPRESPRLAVTLDDRAVAEVAGTIDMRGIRIDKVQLGDSTGQRVYDVQYRTITITITSAVVPRGMPPSTGTVSQGLVAPASACPVTGQRGGSGGYRISTSLAGSDASARPATTRIRDMCSDEWPPVSDTCSRSFSRAPWSSPLMNTSAPRGRVAPRRGTRRIPLPSRLPPRPRVPCSGHAARGGARPCGISLHTLREPPRPGEPR